METKNKIVLNLDTIARSVKHDDGFNKVLVASRAQIIVNLCSGQKILELGCGDGLITKELVRHFEEIIAVDGSKIRIERAKRQLELINDKKGLVLFFVSFFENFEPDTYFDTIIMSGILEHVDDPVLILKKYKKWLKESGSIILFVPNAESIHRRVGKAMGLLSDVHELSKQDFEVGHRRYYDINMLKKDVAESGLKIKDLGGLFFKPLQNTLMEKLDPKIIDGFHELGKELPPEYCAEIYAICQLYE